MKTMKKNLETVFLNQNISYSHLRIAMAIVAIAILQTFIPESKSSEVPDDIALWVNGALSIVALAAVIWFASSKKFGKAKMVIFLSFVNYLRMYAMLFALNILIFPFEAALFRFAPGYNLNSVSFVSGVIFVLVEVYFCFLIYSEIKFLKNEKSIIPVVT